MSRLLKASVLAAGVLVALPAQASVLVTEIMYDVSGTDTGREWVEVTNTGASALDMAGFKFFEANTNHALAIISGTGVLQPGASAVIADDATKFKIDWPGYAGTLFDSTFSLSNSGETLAIKDGALEVEDSVTYDTGAGAAGDGNTLQRSGTTFVAAAPTPGSYTVSSGGSVDPTPPTEATSTAPATMAQGALGTPVAPISVRMRAEERTMVGGGSFFEAKAYGTQGLPLTGTRFIWNFGDGMVQEGARVFHAYAYPGKYAVMVTAAHNYSSAMARQTVEAVAALVRLAAEADSSLAIYNDSADDLDIGLWSLYDRGQHFVIPEDTVILPGEGVRFAQLVTRLPGSMDATLRYPNDSVAATAAPGATSPLRGERIPAPVPSVAPPTVESTPAVINAPLISVDDQVDINAPAEPAAGTMQGAAVATAQDTPDSTILWGSLVGLGALLVVGVAGVQYVRTQAPRAETSPSADEFDIE